MYDPDPLFPGAVVRDFSLSGPRGHEEYATVWDEVEQRFIHVLSGWSDMLSDTYIIIDAAEEVLARWMALSPEARAVPTREAIERQGRRDLYDFAKRRDAQRQAPEST